MVSCWTSISFLEVNNLIKSDPQFRRKTKPFNFSINISRDSWFQEPKEWEVVPAVAALNLAKVVLPDQLKLLVPFCSLTEQSSFSYQHPRSSFSASSGIKNKATSSSRETQGSCHLARLIFEFVEYVLGWLKMKHGCSR